MKINLYLDEDTTAQGLVEYVLILALVAFACAAGMKNLATLLNSAFTAISSTIGQYIK